jgi:hypothetical protein
VHASLAKGPRRNATLRYATSAKANDRDIGSIPWEMPKKKKSSANGFGLNSCGTEFRLDYLSYFNLNMYPYINIATYKI